MGLKTGPPTSGRGFNLIASGWTGSVDLFIARHRDGGESSKGREEQARKLLQWGQQNFATVQIFAQRQKVGSERIWYGTKRNCAGYGTKFLDGAA